LKQYNGISYLIFTDIKTKIKPNLYNHRITLKLVTSPFRHIIQRQHSSDL